MIRPRDVALALASLLLAACPIPQPLPDYPEGQPVTPPRIVVDDGVRAISPGETIVRVPAGCPPAPAPAPGFPLAATLRDLITNESVTARWFVNYDPASQDRSHFVYDAEIPAPDPTDKTHDPVLRAVPIYTFRPYDFAPVSGTGGGVSSAAGAVHVVELVVSNGFNVSYDVPPPAVDLPYRKPLVGFEVQVYRWVFVATQPDPACVGTSCLRCPTP